MAPFSKTNDKSTELPIAVPEFAATHPAWMRLENQLQWYDGKSLHSQRWYKRLKLAQVSMAMLIPVMSLLPPRSGEMGHCGFGRHDRLTGSCAADEPVFDTLGHLPLDGGATEA